MNALTFLKQQHQEVSKLFQQFEEADEDSAKLAIFEEIADALAIHATIEERHFYPAIRDRDTKQELTEAYDEHLEIKKLLVDCMQSTSAPGFDGKVAALEGAVEHHVGEEEDELFPKVKKIFEKDGLEAIGQQLEADTMQMKADGAPRKRVKVEIEPPAAQV